MWIRSLDKRRLINLTEISCLVVEPYGDGKFVLWVHMNSGSLSIIDVPNERQAIALLDEINNALVSDWVDNLGNPMKEFNLVGALEKIKANDELWHPSEKKS